MIVIVKVNCLQGWLLMGLMESFLLLVLEIHLPSNLKISGVRMPRSKVASSDSRFDGGVSHQRISSMNGADSISRTSQRRISRGAAAPALHPPPPTTLMSLAAPDPRAMLHMNPSNPYGLDQVPWHKDHCWDRNMNFLQFLEFSSCFGSLPRDEWAVLCACAQ
ncbi:hypothetical protein ACFX11_023085 [Malus domestica]